MVVKACNRCHSAKEKCTFTGNDQQCIRCKRLKIPCSVSRRSGRIGRRPSAKAFPHGQMQVWSVDLQPSDEPESELTVRRKTTSPSSSRASPAESVSDISEEGWTPTREGLLMLSPERLLATPKRLQTTADALQTVMDTQQFAAIHGPFAMGASFFPVSQQTITILLSCSGPTLTEGYLAFLSLMSSHQRSLVMRPQQADMQKAAKGLQRLRNVNIRHVYDAACALFLGQIMYVFNVVSAPYSNTAHSIVRNALLTTRDWFPSLFMYPIMDTITLTPVLIDTVEAVAHRELPIIRLPPTDRVIIDRYAGIMTTLLPHIHDVAECSNFMKNDRSEPQSAQRMAVWQRLAEIEGHVQEWEPPHQPILYANFSQHEALAMMTQANVYRLATLLVIHRLRYPLGVEDGTARVLAEGIFSAMSLFASSAAEKVTAMPMVFPLTMAMLEVEGPGERLLDILAAFTVQNISAVRLRGFIKAVRTAKEAGFKGTWFELVEDHLHVAMPP
ncbi:hypothetical protein N7468_006245 [Penicillium chermesinum]|uniref:Zn(2)-C6 fungal-type domain-containing protein n=1 Tax=Penicillium chermesinum TaxID=63820 RepID=A0A9W9TKY7_9EURO|nr:uncharacterized protein N7468_006245 [Penicillium chermesinum]KAJ5225020.1 hypothetical protein N7468_006245 [Penicillium chermesinum]